MRAFAGPVAHTSWPLSDVIRHIAKNSGVNLVSVVLHASNQLAGPSTGETMGVPRISRQGADETGRMDVHVDRAHAPVIFDRFAPPSAR
jgi:hypothetical protein